MALYFFHFTDARARADTEGTELASRNAARAEGLRTAGEILRSEGTRGWTDSKWQMTVADADQNVVFTLRFEADDHGHRADL